MRYGCEDYTDEFGNCDYEAYESARMDYIDMKYEEYKDRQIMKYLEEKEKHEKLSQKSSNSK